MKFALVELQSQLFALEDACQEGVQAFHFQRLSSLISKAEHRSELVQTKLLPKVRSGLKDLQSLLVRQQDENESTRAVERSVPSVFKGLVEHINNLDVTAIEQSSLGLDALLFDLDDISDSHLNQDRREKSSNEVQARAKELKSLQVYREQLGKVITENMVRQVIKEDPENAGPLNPQRLLVRTIGAMKDISPAYVNRLVPFFDTLLWLEQAGDCSRYKGSKKSSK